MYNRTIRYWGRVIARTARVSCMLHQTYLEILNEICKGSKKVIQSHCLGILTKELSDHPELSHCWAVELKDSLVFLLCCGEEGLYHKSQGTPAHFDGRTNMNGWPIIVLNWLSHILEHLHHHSLSTMVSLNYLHDAARLLTSQDQMYTRTVLGGSWQNTTVHTYIYTYYSAYILYTYYSTYMCVLQVHIQGGIHANPPLCRWYDSKSSPNYTVLHHSPSCTRYKQIQTWHQQSSLLQRGHWKISLSTPA